MLEKIKRNKIISAVNAFQDSVYYPLALGAVVVLAHILRLDILGFVLLAVGVSFTNIFADDIRPAIPAIFLIQFAVSPRDNVTDIAAYFFNPAVIAALALVAVMIVVTALLRLFFYRQARELLKKRRLLYGLLLWSAALLLSGLFSKYYAADSMLLSLSLILTQLGFYMFFSASLKHREDNLEYAAKVCATVAAVIIIELVYLYATKYTYGRPLDSDWKGLIVIGWGISNTIGELLVFMLMPCFYLVYSKRCGWIYYIFVTLIMAGVYFTLSRNALLIGCAAYVAGTVLCLVRGQNRRALLIAVCVLLVILSGFGIFALVTGRLNYIFAFFKSVLFDDRGRFALWNNMLSMFTEYPVFGTGFSAYGTISGASMKMAHNTLVQVLSSCGVVGLGMYIFHRFETVRLYIARPNVPRSFFGAAVAVYLAMALLDPIFFYANFALYYTLFLVLSEKDLDACAEKDVASCENKV